MQVMGPKFLQKRSMQFLKFQKNSVKMSETSGKFLKLSLVNMRAHLIKVYVSIKGWVPKDGKLNKV